MNFLPQKLAILCDRIRVWLAFTMVYASPILSTFAGDITCTYTGRVETSVLGFQQWADVTVELTTEEAAFDIPAGATFTVRGKVENGSPLVRTIAGEWSNYIKAMVSNNPFRADAKWGDGQARVGANLLGTRLVLAAVGNVTGIDVEVPETTLYLASRGPAVAKPSTAPAGQVDPVDIASFRCIGKNRFTLRDAAVTRKLYTAKQAGDHALMSFEPLGFPVREGKKRTDGGVAIFWLENGTLVGGIFDWHGVGQTRKTMDNIPSGYMEGKQPPEGADIWFCILAYGYRQRTNLCKAPEPWRRW